MPPNEIMYNSGVFVDVDLEGGPRNDTQKESDFETAIHYAGVGKFQNVLLGVSGAIYATCAISSTTLSFVLPSAECDFNLTSSDKGKLSATPLIGMLFGCCIWGSLANSQGRKIAIMVSLLMDFFAAVISSFAYNYHTFLVCRFFNGFGIIGATILIFSYLGEFLSVKDRDKYLGKLEIFWNIGIIILPGVAWSLLNKKAVQVFEDGGNFSPWRIFVLVCSLPSVLCFVLIYFLPETPKFLIEKNKYDKAKLVFRQIYAFNSGRRMEYFPVQTLEGEDNNNELFNSKAKKSSNSTYIESIMECFQVIRHFTNQQYFKYLIITCLADFGLMASYYTLVMWFPEIFDRFSEYNERYPGRPVSICVVSHKNTTFRTMEELSHVACDASIDNKVFLETVIIGLSCIPTSASLSYGMYKIGKKAVLVSSLIMSGICTLALNWVSTMGQTLILACIFEALTSILESVLFCVVVDLFPTNVRALALTITATCGRFGAIFGNIIFGALLDINCVVPIYLFGLLLIISGFLCTAVPRNENYITLH